MRIFKAPASFWNDVMSLDGSATPYVLRRVVIFTGWAILVTAFDKYEYTLNVGIEVTPYEVAGAVLGLLMVVRTNAGYDRWWEARKLWGGIVNQSRNLVVGALAYGPADTAWKERVTRLTIAFAHATRRHLRGEREMPEVAALVGAGEAARYAGDVNPAVSISLDLAEMLRQGQEQGMEPLAFLQTEQQRGILVDHLGGCERILKTPLPRAYTIQIRRFIILFFVTLPFGLIDKVGWLTPIVVMLACYPILSLDKIGVELQNPFSPRNLNHLPLDDICAGIERGLLALIGEQAPIDADKADGRAAAGKGLSDSWSD